MLRNTVGQASTTRCVDADEALGSTITIVALIFVLLILIIVFKT